MARRIIFARGPVTSEIIFARAKIIFASQAPRAKIIRQAAEVIGLFAFNPAAGTITVPTLEIPPAPKGGNGSSGRPKTGFGDHFPSQKVDFANFFPLGARRLGIAFSDSL